VEAEEAEVIEEALALCRGSYQRNLVMGQESWSGSSLQGKARNWGTSYFRSRKALLRRIEEAGIGYLTIEDRGKIVLEFGRPPGYYVETRIACGTAWVPGRKTVLDEIVEAVNG
jgi:hypothetical protein